MANNRITITQEHDKSKTVLYPFYTESDKPLGTVLVLHGMAEHHGRYLGFIEFLNECGYDVFTYDHRGHGLDCKFEELGYIADSDGYRLLINDVIGVLDYIKSVKRTDKLFLFGHSMGSLISRCVIQEYDSIDGVILCGTAHMPMIKSRMGMLVAAMVKLFKGAKHRSVLLNNCTVGYKDFARISDRTSFDWLTRDNTIVGNYINDPYCGFLCTASFYSDLIHLTYTADIQERIAHTRKDLPVLFISGSLDPVGSYGQGVLGIYGIFQKLGFSDVDCTLYEECRHELLNELNYEAIMQDILGWLNKH